MPAKSSVLIIDNDAFLAGIYARKFEADGWKVSVVDSLLDGRKVLMKKSVSAIVLEPDMDEQESELFVKSLRADPKTSTMVIAILSSLFEKKEIERFKKAGVDAYLIKGHFVPTEAVRKVKELLLKGKK